MAQETTPFEKHAFSSPKDGKSLNYRLLKPQTVSPGETYPLVLFLHGAGERGNDNEKQLLHGVTSFAEDSMREAFPAFVIAPQCPEGSQWVNGSWEEKPLRQPAQISLPLRLAFELLEETRVKHPVDQDRIYVTGLSMGGFGTWDLLYRHPDDFAAAVPVCGGAAPDIAKTIKHIPVWNFHGAEDPVVPVSLSRGMHEALSKAGGNIIYTEIPGMGHNSWDVAYDTPEMYRWLFSQKR